jgi:hypothetical protein
VPSCIVWHAQALQYVANSKTTIDPQFKNPSDFDTYKCDEELNAGLNQAKTKIDRATKRSMNFCHI